MAVAFDGFSIRDYTSKMRSIDVFKCWPFRTDDEVSREDVESWLPPMAVPKSRCCSNQLEASRSDRDDDGKPSDVEISRSESDQSVKSEERLEMVCPVCRVFNAATLTAVNAHIDGCLAQTMREERRQMRIMSLKSKSKAPKKRSIAEIFEVQEQLDEEEEQPKIETMLKFWPFGDDNPDEVSITVTKFKWWSRRLEAMRSNKVDGEISGNDAERVKSNEPAVAEEEKLEMVCPVCRDFNASTVTAVNAHIDGCLAQAMREERRQMKMHLKPKPKAPKKRSIAEILTVAPQIKARNSEVVEADKEEEEEEEENRKEKYDYGGGYSSGIDAFAKVSTIKSKKSTAKRKKKRMKKPKRKSKEENYKVVESLNNGKKIMMNKKKKNSQLIAKKLLMPWNYRSPISMLLFLHKITAEKAGGTEASLRVKVGKTENTKEDAYKYKVQTPLNSGRKLRGQIGNEIVAHDDIDTTAHKKKSSLRSLCVEKKQKVKNSDSAGKQQKAVTPACGIVRNHLKHVSGRTSSNSNIQDGTGTEESYHDVQVMTSDRHVKFSGEDDILDQKSRNSSDKIKFNLSSDSLATSLGKKSSGSEEADNLEVNKSDGNIAISIHKKKEVSPIIEDEQFSCTPKQVAVQHLPRACTNQEKSKHLVEKSESLTKEAPCDSNNLHLFERGNMTTVNYSPYGGTPRTLSTPQPGQISSINTQMCDSGAFSSTVKFVDHWKDPSYQIAAVNSNASTRTFLEPSSSYSASHNEAHHKRPQLASQFYGGYDNNGQSLGDRPFSHMFSAGMVDNSFAHPGWGKGSVRNNCTDESVFSLPLNSHGELINFNSSGKVAVNQLQTSGTSRVTSSGLPLNNIVCQSSDDCLSINERSFVQKTLGKDREDSLPHYPARLGVTELQSSERSEIHWSNSDSSSTSNLYARPLDSELNLTRNSFIEQNQHNQVQKMKENQMVYLKESSDRISPSYSQPTMRLMGKDVPISRSNKEMEQFVEDAWADEDSRRRHCSKQNLVSGSPSQTSTENVLQSVKIQSNQASRSNYVSQNGNLGVSRNASSYFFPNTQASSSCAVSNRAPNDLPKQFISGSKPLGLGQQFQGATNPCNFTQPAYGFSFFNPSVEEHPQTSWFQRSYRSMPPWLLSTTHENLSRTPSQQFSGMNSRSFPHNKWGGNFTAPSVNHPAEVVYPNPLTSHCEMKTPLCPASIVRPPHVPVTQRSIITFADRVKLDAEDNRCRNPRKRPAANLEDSTTTPIKLLNIEVQDSPMQWNTRAVELDPRGDSARSKYFRPNEAQSIHHRGYPGIECFKPDGMISSGPIRLSPGAKHILKPLQNTEQDNSRPIHSSIPIAATSDHGAGQSRIVHAQLLPGTLYMASGS
ncbi:uncharacterized protein G2W53_029727 [Senna tora]|uniref:UBZ4-type domain-containing protein n=1 Tax=Senna tora TaxID=362788 RepID=A0A834T630_9FABA|nr:uncharacterized protein G2W53_029727 [Senna tora]